MLPASFGIVVLLPPRRRRGDFWPYGTKDVRRLTTFDPSCKKTAALRAARQVLRTWLRQALSVLQQRFALLSRLFTLRAKRRQTSAVFRRFRAESSGLRPEGSRPERSRLFGLRPKSSGGRFATWLRRPLFDLRSKRAPRSLVLPGYGSPFLA